jgi:hypothetical protein
MQAGDPSPRLVSFAGVCLRSVRMNPYRVSPLKVERPLNY